MGDTDLELLARYTRHHAEDAFTEIVRRHLDLVYSTALRQVRSPQLAEEVAQSAFACLALHADRLRPDTVLAAWLYQVTRRTAMDTVRRETRRQVREQIATEMNAADTSNDDWSRIEPLLDEAMQALDEKDRTAVLLRFFENRSLREVGAILGTSENAAQKRLGRAVERLRDFLARRGVAVGANGLVLGLATHAVQAAPAGLTGAISSGATFAAMIAASSASSSTIQTLAMTTLQKSLIAATVTVALGTGIYESFGVSSLRKQVASLQEAQAPLNERLQRLQREHQKATDQLALLAEENAKLKAKSEELLQLRAEASRMRHEANVTRDPVVIAALAAKARLADLRQRLAQMPEHQIPQLEMLTEEDWEEIAKQAQLDTEVGLRRALGQLRTQARGKVGGLVSAALDQYVRDHGGELPGDLSDLKPHFKTPLDDAILQQYQLLHTGKVSDLPPGQWLINERAPLEDGFDSTFHIGYNMFGVEREGSLEGALGRFYEANPGQEPASTSQLLPFAKHSP